MKLRLRAAAVRDLDGIFDYSVTMHGAAVAEAYTRDLNAAMERLLDFPELGVSRESLQPGLRSLPAGEHRIFYRIEGRKIVVARILHKRWMSGGTCRIRPLIGYRRTAPRGAIDRLDVEFPQPHKMVLHRLQVLGRMVSLSAAIGSSTTARERQSVQRRLGSAEMTLSVPEAAPDHVINLRVAFYNLQMGLNVVGIEKVD